MMSLSSDLVLALEELQQEMEASGKTARKYEPNDYLAGHADSTKYWERRMLRLVKHFAYLADKKQCPVCESKAIRPLQGEYWKCSLCGIPFIP
jgi:rubredoxin